MTPTDYQNYIKRMEELLQNESLTLDEETELQVLDSLCTRFEDRIGESN